MTSDPSHPPRLSPVGVFAEFDADEIDQLDAAGDIVPLPAGRDLIRQHQDHACLYVIVRGRFLVYRMQASFETTFGELEEGESVGEMNFLDRREASANVRAITDSLVWRLPRDQFDSLVAGNPQLGLKLYRALAIMVVRRLRTAIDSASQQGNALLEGWW